MLSDGSMHLPADACGSTGRGGSRLGLLCYSQWASLAWKATPNGFSFALKLAHGPCCPVDAPWHSHLALGCPVLAMKVTMCAQAGSHFVCCMVPLHATGACPVPWRLCGPGLRCASPQPAPPSLPISCHRFPTSDAFTSAPVTALLPYCHERG